MAVFIKKQRFYERLDRVKAPFDAKLSSMSVENNRFCDFGGCPELGIRFTMEAMEHG